MSGTYTIVHTLTDECGTSPEELEVVVDCCLEPQLSIDVPVPLAQYAPVADINVTDQFCLNIAFESVNTAENFSYDWEFFDVDGTTSLGTATGPTTDFAFPATGTYDVELTVTDDCDPANTTTITEPVSVDDCSGVTLDCDCPTGYEIAAAPGSEVALSTLINTGYLPEVALQSTCLAVAPFVTFVVDQDYLLGEVEVIMNEGSEILVSKGEGSPTLTVSGTLAGEGIHGCGKMWKGITVKDAILFVRLGAIADARYAIWAQNKSKINVSESLFERNYISLYGFDPNAVGPYRINAFWGNEVDGTENFLPAYAGQTPAPGQRPYTGILLIDGEDPVAIGSNTGDPSGLNDFHDLRNGILSENTALTVVYSVFRNITQTSAEPYPFTGYGIRHEGGAADPFFQRGIGSGTSDDASFDNVTQAIWIDGTKVDIAQNRIINTRRGVAVQMAFNRDIAIESNRMQVTHMGIELEQNAANATNLEVRANTITSSRNGIVVDEMGASYGEGKVWFNDITCTGRQNAILVRNVGNADFSNNNIDMNQASFPAAGIFISNSSNCTVKENSINGPGAASDIDGILAINTDNVAYYCNTLEELTVGLELQGNCTGASIRTNVFDPGTQGMGIGLLYPEGLMIGTQGNAGNLWEVNTGLPNDGYITAGARNFQETLLALSAQQYEVSEDTPPLTPPFMDFPNFPLAQQQNAADSWFFEQGTADEECSISGEPDPIMPPEDIHRLIARAQLSGLSYLEAMLWLSQLELYKNIEDYPNWNDTVLDSFYLAQSGRLLEDFHLLDKDRRQVLENSPTEMAALTNWEQDLDELIQEVLLQDSLILAGDSTYIESKDSLLNEAGTLCIAMDSLELIILQDRLTVVQQLLLDNAALSDTSDYQTYEKVLNSIFLSTIAQGSTSLDSTQVDTLLSIAGKCPLY